MSERIASTIADLFEKYVSKGPQLTQIEMGPLGELDLNRGRILQDVVGKSSADLLKSYPEIELLLSQALYSEKSRLKKNRGNWFTKPRLNRDRELWNRIQVGLLSNPAKTDREGLLGQVITHYSEEIGGRFDPGVYRFATRVVPVGFNWMLNAASVRRFLPWKMTEDVSEKLKIEGEIDHLKKLSKIGTVLLVPTHLSNIDSILIGYVINQMGLPPFSYGAGLNLYSNPVLSYFMSHLGAYTVDRQKNNEIYKAVLKNYSTKILRQGIHSIFFPGGGRCRSGAVESKLKLGLLGTAIDAEIYNRLENASRPRVFVVPMVLSYNFVLEASSLIEDYLSESGKHRFLNNYDESYRFFKVMGFFWKFFSKETGIAVRIGKPMDVVGNLVDENGQSMGAGGSTIDLGKWFTTKGELCVDPSRDHQYTRELGQKIVKRFHQDHTVLCSHVVSFSFFEHLRDQYPDLDLFQFLRISLAQRSRPLDSFLKIAERVKSQILELADRGECYVEPALREPNTRKWVLDAISKLGIFHDNSVLRVSENAIWTEDMNLLYFYRNRLTGYGLGLGARSGMGEKGAKGFLE